MIFVWWLGIEQKYWNIAWPHSPDLEPGGIRIVVSENSQQSNGHAKELQESGTKSGKSWKSGKYGRRKWNWCTDCIEKLDPRIWSRRGSGIQKVKIWSRFYFHQEMWKIQQIFASTEHVIAPEKLAWNPLTFSICHQFWQSTSNDSWFSMKWVTNSATWSTFPTGFKKKKNYNNIDYFLGLSTFSDFSNSSI